MRSSMRIGLDHLATLIGQSRLATLPQHCYASSQSLDHLRRCDGLSSCTVSVSSSELPDACPGTRKYLEVHYACVNNNNNNNIHAVKPPWLARTENVNVDGKKQVSPLLS
jgi:hypothetical protein